jgi:hypothetical protein
MVPAGRGSITKRPLVIFSTFLQKSTKVLNVNSPDPNRLCTFHLMASPEVGVALKAMIIAETINALINPLCLINTSFL